MKLTRPYSMDLREQSTVETRTRILQAVLDLSREKMTIQIVLADVADRAAVSVQTVLRHFGSRQGLLEATRDFASETVAAERRAPVGDLDADIHVLFDHYELRGDAVMRFLAEALWDSEIDALLRDGRRLHRNWVSTVFAPQLDDFDGRARGAMVDQLVVVTDVYTWKLLRRDRALDRDEAEGRVRDMARNVIAGATERK